MVGRLRRMGLMSLLLVGVTLGCTKPAVQHKEPPDPLLVTKKPVEGRQRLVEADGGRYESPPVPPSGREASPVNVQRDGAAPIQPVLLGVEPGAPDRR